MKQTTGMLLASGAVLVLSGCPAFFVDRGELVSPTRSLAPPSMAALPDQSAYVDLAGRWRRETRVGIGGFIEATLQDPLLAAADVAHEAAVKGLSRESTADLLAARWLTLYGHDTDRWPIDLAWRFDEQFISNRRILDPATWQLVLVGSDGRQHLPLAVTTLMARPVPEGGYWQGAIRLWFPWRDPSRPLPLLGGENEWVRLEVSHPSGVGALTWRFRSLF